MSGKAVCLILFMGRIEFQDHSLRLQVWKAALVDTCAAMCMNRSDDQLVAIQPLSPLVISIESLVLARTLPFSNPPNCMPSINC